MNTGELVRRARAHSGLSQTAFAKEIGASRSSVNQWENNYHKPKLDNVLTIIEHINPHKSLSDKLLASIGHSPNYDNCINLSPEVHKSFDSKLNKLVSGLFDLVIAGEITIRPGGDPEEIAKHLYVKIFGEDALVKEHILDSIAEKNTKHNKHA